MKRLFCFLMTALLLLCGCDNQTTANPPQQDDATTDSAFEFTGEVLPLKQAQNAYYADGNLYYCKDSFVRFTILESGHDQVLCFDPLCPHDDKTLFRDCPCPAVCFQDSLLARVLVDDGKAWFLATVFPGAESDKAVRYHLRCMDLDSMKTKIYLEKNEMRIWDFWKYGDDIYLLMPTQKTKEDGTLTTSGGDIYRLNGTKAEIVYASPDGTRTTLLSSGPGSIYFTTEGGTTQQASPDFSVITDAKDYPLSLGLNQQIFDGYVYYQKKTGKCIVIDGILTEGDYADEVSTLVSEGFYEVSLYRQKLGGDGTEELVYASMPEPDYFKNSCNYYIDKDSGKIYLTPLDPVCVGYTVWEEKASIAAISGITKPILTNVFSSTSGRLVAVDTKTLEARDVLSNADVDILDIFAVENGKVMGNLKLNNIDKLIEMKEDFEGRHNSVSSSLKYDYYGSIPLD